MDYHRGDTPVARRAYAYANRSELISGVVDGTGLNGWDYDLADAASSPGVATKRQLSPNRLNQYTAIEDAKGTFTPTYDARYPMKASSNPSNEQHLLLCVYLDNKIYIIS